MPGAVFLSLKSRCWKWTVPSSHQNQFSSRFMWFIMWVLMFSRQWRCWCWFSGLQLCVCNHLLHRGWRHCVLPKCWYLPEVHVMLQFRGLASVHDSLGISKEQHRSCVFILHVPWGGTLLVPFSSSPVNSHLSSSILFMFFWLIHRPVNNSDNNRNLLLFSLLLCVFCYLPCFSFLLVSLPFILGTQHCTWAPCTPSEIWGWNLSSEAGYPKVFVFFLNQGKCSYSGFK